MNQENVLKILAGGAKLAKHATNNLKTKSGEFIKENILQNEFVTREEYEQLRHLVLKLSEDLKKSKATHN